jgi:hypothetical protein
VSDEALIELGVVEELLKPGLEKIRSSLAREGADIEVVIDVATHSVTATLVRNRIVCEGCLLPAHLVEAVLRRTLSEDDRTRPVRWTISTNKWAS